MYKLASNCKVIKGYRNSIIIDLQHQKMYRYDNEIINLLFNDVNSYFSSVEIEGIFEELLRNDVFINIDSDDYDNFSKLSLKYEYPAIINNSIIEIDTIKYEVLNTIFNQLNDLLCKHIELRFIVEIGLKKIDSILKLLDTTTIQTADLHIKYYSRLQTSDLINLKKNKRVHWVVLHSMPEYDINLKQIDGVVYTTESLDNHSCGVISPFYFSQHINHFTESLKFNTCLNRKICINSNGDIKNCLVFDQVFGNIKNTKLKDVLRDSGFVRFWHIKKDNIETCSKCEFRHLCTDCRAFIKDIHNINSQPSKCFYNPFIGRWPDEPDYIPVEEWKKFNKISNS